MAHWDSRNEDEKDSFSRNPYTFSPSQYASHSSYTDVHVESSQANQWQDNDSNWDVFSGVVSPVRRSTSREVGSRDADFFSQTQFHTA